ncbi:PREDICTED: uncharacterized protein LOC101306546 [Fragaria vesca subsp. vesca]|uniref:uncharacterized protein LOC101306546 n=1 Tax=Fragaria vesca subsp. vesca TaxID=101020 RepID=UPI0002C378C5|nr:PREDICTED: uncharacterized protein LOC101306546 [Fragaria vesca subsp. vesca]
MGDVTTSKRSKALSSESVAAPEDLIDELPECLLVDILCRLPRNTVVQCKRVSKSWLTLISKPCFHAHFLSLQKHNPPFETTLMFVRTSALEIQSFTIPLKHTRVSNVLKFSHIYNVVAGTCNDLVLWCATPMFQIRCYYISNPYTNHCVPLPLAPQCHQAHVVVGLICDSYHRCKVVRILECEEESALFMVEIFSSETSEWTQAVVPFPQGLTYDDIRSSVNNVGLACNGTLYWLVSSGLVIGLDPSQFDNSCIPSAATVPANHNFHYSFISKPDVDAGLSASSSCEQCLTVFRGRLSLCQFYNEGPPSPILYVWDLKEDDHEMDGVGRKSVKWCLKEKIVLDELIASLYWKPLAFHPNDEDKLYALCYYPRNNAKKCFICEYNIRKSGRSAIRISEIPLQNRVDAFPLLIPGVRLPTPVPGLVPY